MALDLVYNRNEKDIIFQGFLGGSIINTSKVLNTYRIYHYLISRVGNDFIGKIIIQRLGTYALRNFIVIDDRINTSLALCEIDENKEAKYRFYKDTKKIDNYSNILKDSTLDKIKLALFASSFSYIDSSFDFVNSLMKKFNENGVLIYYDINLRKILEPKYKNRVLNNIKRSTIVKGSIDDFYFLFGTKDINEIYKELRKLNKNYGVITSGKDGSYGFYNNTIFFVEQTNKVDILDKSIGAGDSFSAGFLMSLINNNLLINEQNLKDAIENGNFTSFMYLSNKI